MSKRKINLTDRVAVVIDFLYLEHDEKGTPFYNPDKEWESEADFMACVSGDFLDAFGSEDAMFEWRKKHGYKAD